MFPPSSVKAIFSNILINNTQYTKNESNCESPHNNNLDDLIFISNNHSKMANQRLHY